MRKALAARAVSIAMLLPAAGAAQARAADVTGSADGGTAPATPDSATSTAAVPATDAGTSTADTSSTTQTSTTSTSTSTTSTAGTTTSTAPVTTTDSPAAASPDPTPSPSEQIVASVQDAAAGDPSSVVPAVAGATGATSGGAASSPAPPAPATTQTTPGPSSDAGSSTGTEPPAGGPAPAPPPPPAPAPVSVVPQASAQNVSYIYQAIVQVQEGCQTYCYGTSQTQTASQSASTTQTAAASGSSSVPSAAEAINVATTIQIVVQTQLGCVAFCFGTSQVQSASQQAATSQSASATANAISTALNVAESTQFLIQIQQGCQQACDGASIAQLSDQGVATDQAAASAPPFDNTQTFLAWLAVLAANSNAVVQTIYQQEIANCLDHCTGDAMLQAAEQAATSTQDAVAAIDGDTRIAPVQDDPGPVAQQPVVVGPQPGAGPALERDQRATQDAAPGMAGSGPAGSAGAPPVRRAAPPDDPAFGAPLAELMAAPRSPRAARPAPRLESPTRGSIGYVASIVATAPTVRTAAEVGHAEADSGAAGPAGGARRGGVRETLDAGARTLARDLRTAAAVAAHRDGSDWPGPAWPIAGLAALGALLAFRIGTRRRARSSGYGR